MEWIFAIYETIVDFIRGFTAFIINFSKELFEFLEDPVALLNKLITYLTDWVYVLGNEIPKILASLINFVSTLMPTIVKDCIDCGTDSLNFSAVPQFLSTFNWVFPTTLLACSLTVVMVSSAAWLTIGILTRWLRITG